MKTARETGRGEWMRETKAREDKLPTAMVWLETYLARRRISVQQAHQTPFCLTPAIGHDLFLDKARVSLRITP